MHKEIEGFKLKIGTTSYVDEEINKNFISYSNENYSINRIGDNWEILPRKFPWEEGCEKYCSIKSRGLNKNIKSLEDALEIYEKCLK